MLKLSYSGIADRDAWRAAGLSLPDYDPEAVADTTEKNPVWLHFSAGNVFRAFIASLQDRLLNEGYADRGIIAVETHDPDILEKVNKPYDNLCIVTTLRPAPRAEDGAGRVIGSVSKAYATRDPADYEAVRKAFMNPGLQMVSFTVTEKAYLLRGADGTYLPDVERGLNEGPRGATGTPHTDVGRDAPGAPHTDVGRGILDAPPVFVGPSPNIMLTVAGLLYERYRAGAYSLALVSMDNCSRNGERLRSSVMEIADTWAGRGLCDADFPKWVGDESRVSFPWSMIDKITPWPSEAIAARLTSAGVADMTIVKTERGTVVAPFVNTEPAQYLVIENNFPGGRPALEKADVIFADRETVESAERMKVATCLNPLHTTLAIFGFLLGYDSIAAEMRDPVLNELCRRVAYIEGLPVSADPGVINPKAFLDEAFNERLPNPMIPDAPPRIAADTSQKIPIRFGGTIELYIEKYESGGGPPPSGLIGIPLVLAGWLRYLLCVDDNLKAYTPSPDPMLGELRARLSGISVRDGAAYGRRSDVSGNAHGSPGAAYDGSDAAYDGPGGDAIRAILMPVLADVSLFGADLSAAGLDGKIARMFFDMLEGPGAVRRTLEKYLS